MKELCRLCAKDKTLRELTFINQTLINIEESLAFYCHIILENDDTLPQKVCNICISMLEDFIQFTNEIQKSQKTIREKVLCSTSTTDCFVAVDRFSESQPFVKQEMILDFSDYLDDTESQTFDSSATNYADDQLTMVENTLKRPRAQKNVNSVYKVFEDELKGSSALMMTHLSMIESGKNSDGSVSEEALQKIHPKRWSDISFRCQHCGTEFSTISMLKNHTDTMHGKNAAENKFSCGICEKFNFRQISALINHVLSKHYDHLRFCCMQCNTMFWNIPALFTHYQREHRGEFRCVNPCFVCGTVYDSFRDLTLHRLSHIKKDNSRACQVFETTFSIELKSKFESSVCNLQLSAVDKNADGSVTESCASRLDKWDEICMECRICADKADSPYELMLHYASYHPDSKMNFDCGLCRSSYSLLRSYLYHHVNVHNDNLSYCCIICSKYFWNYVGLHNHYRRCHTLYKAFMCLLCGRHHDNFIAVSEHAKSHKGYQLASKSLKSKPAQECSETSLHVSEMAFVKTEIDYDEYGEEETQFGGSDLMQQEDDDEIETENVHEDSLDEGEKTMCKEEYYDDAAGTSKKAMEDDVSQTNYNMDDTFNSTGFIGVLFKDELDGKSPLKPYTLGLLSKDRNPDGSISEELTSQISSMRYSDLKYSCSSCSGLSFPSVVHLKNHYDSEHVNDRSNMKYDCSVCGESCKLMSAYLNHVSRKHFGHLRFCCIFCDTIFFDVPALYQHLLSEHQKFCSRVIPCLLCGAYADHFRDLKTHFASHKKKVSCEPLVIFKDIIGDNYSTSVPQTKYDLAMPKIHQLPDGSVSNEYAANFMKWNSIAMSCNECELEIQSPRNLMEHYKTAHSDCKNTIYKCSKSNNCASRKQPITKFISFTMHEMAMHDDNLSYCCIFCDKIFWSYLAVYHHYFIHHADYTTHLCLMCGKHHVDSFKYKIHLKSHKALRQQLKNGSSSVKSKSTVKMESDSEGSGGELIEPDNDQYDNTVPQATTSTVNVFIQLPESVQQYEDEDPFAPALSSKSIVPFKKQSKKPLKKRFTKIDSSDFSESTEDDGSDDESQEPVLQKHKRKGAVLYQGVSNIESLFAEELDGTSTVNNSYLDVFEHEKNQDGTVTAVGEAKYPKKWIDFSFQCPQCNEQLETALNLRKHFEMEHQNKDAAKQVYTCDCGEKSKQISSFVNHVTKRHHDHLRFCCLQCSKLFWSLPALFRHSRAEHSIESRRIFPCLCCGVLGESMSVIKDHKAIHVSKSNSKTLQAYIQLNQPQLDIPMKDCRFNLEIPDQFKLPDGSIEPTFEMTLTKWTSLTMNCLECLLDVNSPYDLMVHYKSAHPTSKSLIFDCKKCPEEESIHQLKTFISHEATTHNQQLSYCCVVCQKTYWNYVALHKHYSNVHDCYNPYLCLICGRHQRSMKKVMQHLGMHKNNGDISYIPKIKTTSVQPAPTSTTFKIEPTSDKRSRKSEYSNKLSDTEVESDDEVDYKKIKMDPDFEIDYKTEINPDFEPKVVYSSEDEDEEPIVKVPAKRGPKPGKKQAAKKAQDKKFKKYGETDISKANTVEKLFKDELNNTSQLATALLSVLDCERMLDGTISEQGLLTINSKRWSNFEYKCDICKKLLPTVLELKTHCQSVHADTIENIYSCSECPEQPDQKFKRCSRFINHVTKKHHEHLRFSCLKCNDIFWNIGSLYKHYKTKHPFDVSKIFPCLICGHYFDGIVDLRIHKYTHFKRKDSNSYKSFENIYKNELDISMSESSFNLPIDDAHKNSDGSVAIEFAEHMSQWRNLQMRCNECMHVLSSPHELQMHYSSSHPSAKSVFDCVPCQVSGGPERNKFGDVKSYLMHHTKNHDSTLSYSCYMCSKAHWNYSALFRHYEAAHPLSKILLCLHCGKLFDDFQRMKKHAEVHDLVPKTYNKPQTFNCVTCLESFTKKSLYEKHGCRANSKVKKEKAMAICEVCGKSFDSRSKLQVHMAVHTGKIFACHICSKTFSSKYVLKYHLINLHSDKEPEFECDICKIKFKYKAVLSRHMLTHTGEWPFGCSFCDKRFRSNSDLVIHERLHTGEYNYACPVEGCTDRYPSWSNLFKHCIARHKLDIRSEYVRTRNPKGVY